MAYGLTDSPNVDRRGEFVQGTDALFFFSFPDLEGELYDPSDIDISITDPSDTEVESATEAEKVEDGQYAYVWSIPSDADTGLYTITVTFTIEKATGPDTGTFTEQFVVTEAATTAILDPKTLAARTMLEYLLGYTQRIPVFREPARMNKTRTAAELTFPRWNQPAGAKIWLNGELYTDQVTINWLKGTLEFSSPLSQYDEVTADYNFRWFSDDELDNFIVQAINVFNQYPPHSAYRLYNVPERYFITMEYQAVVIALRRLLMDLMYQEPIKVYGGPQNWDNILQRLERLKENYEKELEKLYEQKKYGPYVGLTRTVTVPEYTLPGGRSRWFRYLFKGA